MMYIFINLNLWMHLFVTFYKVTARVDVHLGGGLLPLKQVY